MRQRSAGRVHHPLSGIPIRATLVTAFVIALGLLFFGRGNSAFDGIRLAVGRASGGFYEFVGPPIATARSFIGNIFRVFEVYRENDKLKAQNAELKAWQSQALTLQQKVARYEALLEMPLDPDIEYRTGRVLDDPGGPFVRTFRMNLGTKNGVVEGQAVMDEHGLLGRIVAAGKTASRILLITDLNSRVPVTIEPISSLPAMLTVQPDSTLIISGLTDNNVVSAGWRVFVPGRTAAEEEVIIGELEKRDQNLWTVRRSRRIDPASLSGQFAVRIEPSSVRGMLIGQNDSMPVVTFLPREFRVGAGWRVVTSGNGGLLPPDIPVGVVTDVRGDKVLVKPATEFASVDFVRVLDYTSPVTEVPYSTQGPPLLNGPPILEKTPPPSAAPAPPVTPPAAANTAPPKPTVPRLSPAAANTAPTEIEQGDTEAAPPDPTPGVTSVALPPPAATPGGGFE